VTPAEAVGAELSADVVDECRNRLNHLRGLSFVSIKELDDPRHKCAYDGVVCMEVLEHVVDLNSVLDTIAGLLVSGGRLLISVPVETGIPFMFKQAVRTIAGWRGIGDYPGITSYTWREYWATVFASSGQHIERPIYQTGDGLGFHDHKGFNWMAFRKSLDRRFKMQRMWASPLTRLPPHLASQVWFLLRVRS
jgi:SAM-dependent methyltransferase